MFDQLADEFSFQDLFNRIGPVSNLSLVYDRAGRSEGVAYVTYNRANDARTAIAEFDGANAKGQPIRLTLVASGPGRRGRNPFDNVEPINYVWRGTVNCAYGTSHSHEV